MLRDSYRTKRYIKTLQNLFAVAAFLLVFSSCGLEKLIYLYPVEDWRVQRDGLANGLVFYHNTENNGLISSQNFLGYEVFYKFYLESSATGGIEADRSYFYERYISSEAAITAQGFLPLHRTADNLSAMPPANPLQRPNRPFLPVSSSGTYTYAINFPTGAGTGLTNIWGASISIAAPSQTDQPVFRIFNGDYLLNPSLALANYFYLYRILNTTQNNHRKSFLPRSNTTSTETTASIPPETINYSYYNNSGDPDMQRVSGYTPGSNLCVGFCVVAYGRDDNFSPIYSEAIVINAGPAYGIYVQF
ncbi:MAG: hypothetical protein LBT33_08955 [Spirochaetia bacterium]|jgi:hypothetical protein|nr:hypothetical protein [Spirochaetia bacterium]